MSNYVSVDMIRNEVMDRTPDDNDLEFDITFEDGDIEAAMASCMRDYNGIAPLIGGISHPGELPADTNLFVDGTIYFLLRSFVNKLSRNDIDVEAGGVKVNINARRIDRLSKIRDEARESYQTAARNRKLTQNLRRAFGRVG